jgi:hypothetical protein
MARVLTAEQLQVGANGIAYRAQQLAGVAVLLRPHLTLSVETWIGQVINNALIESALVEARVLAWFFAGKNVCTSDFLPGWKHLPTALTDKIIATISRHLSHAMENAAEGEPHPGEWPIAELAHVLVLSLDQFVSDLGNRESSRWFVPEPASTAVVVRSLDVPSNPTPLSQNPSVRDLAKALRQHVS